jgi:hypothetical protein
MESRSKMGMRKPMTGFVRICHDSSVKSTPWISWVSRNGLFWGKFETPNDGEADSFMIGWRSSRWCLTRLFLGSFESSMLGV